MSSELHPRLDRSLSRRFAAVADDDRVTRTVAALEANGISVLRARNAGEAKRIVLDLIPAGSQVHHGASLSLEVAGICRRDRDARSIRTRPLTHLEHGPRDASRRDSPPDIVTGRDAGQRARGHRDRIAGRGLGQWQPARPLRIRCREGHPRRGTQKTVSDLEDARRRIDEYAFPLEDARAQAAYGVHSGVNKVLIINREWTPDRTTVVLVDKALGF